jgi:uncharacterized protein (DUF2164 family)
MANILEDKGFRQTLQSKMEQYLSRDTELETAGNEAGLVIPLPPSDVLFVMRSIGL